MTDCSYSKLVRKWCENSFTQYHYWRLRDRRLLQSKMARTITIIMRSRSRTPKMTAAISASDSPLSETNHVCNT